MSLTRLRHCLSNAAHATFDQTPSTLAPRNFPHSMVQHGETRPGLAKGCIVSRHNMRGDHCFHFWAFKPSINNRFRGTNKKLHQSPARLRIEAKNIDP